MKKAALTFLLVTLISLLAVAGVVAQTTGLSLSLSRDFGYGGFGGEIQGLFSMRVTGPADLARVEFYIDDIKIGEVDKAPFNLQFSTDNYSLGAHQLHAVGFSTTGQEYTSNIITPTFVPAQSSMKVILPVLGIVLAAVLLSAVVPLIASRRKHASIPLGSERNYGINGGAIC